MPDGFRDYIPDGEDLGALTGGNGYTDFVPEATVEKVEKVEKVEVVKENKADVFSCPNCDYTTIYKVALAGHSRKHK